MKKSLLVAIPLAGMLMFSGCATIMSGKTQKLSITSNPNGKIVTIGSQQVVTPSSIQLKRSADAVMVAGNDCNAQKKLESSLNPLFFANIIWVYGAPFSSTTDYATDAMWKYDENVHLNCKK